MKTSTGSSKQGTRVLWPVRAMCLSSVTALFLWDMVYYISSFLAYTTAQCGQGINSPKDKCCFSSGPGGILFWVGQAPFPWDAGSCFSLGTGMCDHSGGPMHHFLGCMALLQLRHWGGMTALTVQGTVFPKRRILLQLPSKSVRERMGEVAPSLLGSSRTEPTVAPSSA